MFWDREADAAFEDALITNTDKSIWIEKLKLHANSEEFGVAVANRFISLMNVSSK